jgi:hypothetical protein
MANFSGDLQNASSLAYALLQHKVNPNLIDDDEKSPVHAAIKKD